MAPLTVMARDSGFRALYFGRGLETGGTLFGWFHAVPSGSEATEIVVVICPPLGYEGICAQPAMRAFAERLADAGYPVLRLDYEGTGDAGGLDSDPGRVRAWLDSVSDAVDVAKRVSGAAEVCLFGVRMGATLAAVAAAERDDVDHVALWGACAKGKTYLREMRAFKMLAEQTGEMSFKPRSEGDMSQESGGFLFNAETVDALKGIDLGKLERRIAPRVLVLERDGVPGQGKLSQPIADQGAETTTRSPSGYSDMMVAPDQSVFPAAVCSDLLAWLGEADTIVGLGGAASPARDRHAGGTRSWGVVAEGVREEVVRFGPEEAMVGVLTSPIEAVDPRPLIVFSNTAGNYRIGPSRLYVELARKWATMGWRTFRLDVSGVGDSILHEDELRNHPYSDQLFDDVSAALDELERRELANSFVLAGLCSGAFVAYHAALAQPRVQAVVLINLQTFEWTDGMSLEVNPLRAREATQYYRSRILEPEVWKKALSGGIDVGRFVRFARERAVDVAQAGVAQLKTRLPVQLAPASEVARSLDALTTRGTDVTFVFANDDPGVDNLNRELGGYLAELVKRPNFHIATIEGSDHSFTPLWAQQELDTVVTSHLSRLLPR
jgi:dienelactone hydrolase